jgi:hypothetical protein
VSAISVQLAHNLCANEGWAPAFAHTLGPAERSLLFEMREWRDKWAHQEPFSSDDTYRALDSAARLLAAVSAREAVEVERRQEPTTSGSSYPVRAAYRRPTSGRPCA